MLNNKTVGILDLGSNTFHLLIAEFSNGKFEIKLKKRIFVGLAEGGIESIKKSALQRAENALSQFAAIVSNQNLDKFQIIGTAALRSAKNAQLIQNICIHLFKKKIDIIDGAREADLIYKGVKQVAKIEKGNHLIMDIGGGSTEFILIEKGKNIWAKSFNVGVGILHNLFHKNEPISFKEIDSLNAYLDTTLSQLIKKVSTLKIDSLIGASGSFEIIASMTNKPIFDHQTQLIDIGDFYKIAYKVISSDYEKRAGLAGMPATRVKLSVVAFLKLKFILDLVKPKTIEVSPYALKEGLLAEIGLT